MVVHGWTYLDTEYRVTDHETDDGNTKVVPNHSSKRRDPGNYDLSRMQYQFFKYGAQAWLQKRSHVLGQEWELTMQIAWQTTPQLLSFVFHGLLPFVLLAFQVQKRDQTPKPGTLPHRRKDVQMEGGGCQNHLGPTIIPTTDLMYLNLTSHSAGCNHDADWGRISTLFNQFIRQVRIHQQRAMIQDYRRKETWMYYNVEYGASLGFATIATNNGHQGYTGAPFLRNLDVIQDFAYRSIENGVSIGKQDILDQCDTLDGVADGILESPDLCKYNPDGLRCAKGDGQTSGCLTATQLETLKSIYSPVLDAAGSLVYPKMQFGSEFTGAVDSYFSGSVWPVSDWWCYAIFNDPTWDPMTFRPENYTVASGLNHFNIDTWEGDLGALQSRGGKLLHWHGLADGVLSSENSPRYYEHVSQTMGTDSDALDTFYRYFRVSGMSHCGSGNGATFIGHQSASTASLAPEENVLMAVVQWVENEVAPETIMGTRYINGSKDNGVDFQRRHCRWPYHNMYQGVGDYKDPNTWKCVL
ncbi:feruloyl esterase b [Colletotrichum camelliae]|nr:feruloyl esterase b [Colletotrichum camelliae]